MISAAATLSVPPGALASTVNVPLLARLPVKVLATAVPVTFRVAAEVLSVTDLTVTGAVSETVPKGITASSSTPGTVPVLQSAATVQFAVPSIHVAVAIQPRPLSKKSRRNRLIKRLCRSIRLLIGAGP